MLAIGFIIFGFLGIGITENIHDNFEDQNERVIIIDITMNTNIEEIVSDPFILNDNQTYDIIVYHFGAEGSGRLVITDETSQKNTTFQIEYFYGDNYYASVMSEDQVKSKYDFKGQRLYLD